LEIVKGNRRFGGLRHGWEDNIKMYLREIGCGVVEELVWDMSHWRALVNTVMKF
jgi:hypothetical protein